jgi:hypothetical protein
MACCSLHTEPERMLQDIAKLHSVPPALLNDPSPDAGQLRTTDIVDVSMELAERKIRTLMGTMRPFELAAFAKRLRDLVDRINGRLDDENACGASS